MSRVPSSRKRADIPIVTAMLVTIIMRTTMPGAVAAGIITTNMPMRTAMIIHTAILMITPQRAAVDAAIRMITTMAIITNNYVMF